MLADGDVTEQVIGAAIEVHKHLGPGLLESTYEACLCHELALRGVQFERQMSIPLSYKGVQLACGHRIDLVVERRVIVELKSVDALIPLHEAQLLTYLRTTGLHTGLIINFNVRFLRDGIVRRVL
ncbi:MAG TPA: GxxExxY protein [Armatimonadota bacterium]|jgi:GxxExxY protein